MSKHFLRHTALIEGISWLLLLFVAMPLKYFAANPLPVKYIGMAHGLLFVLLCFLIVDAVTKTILSKKFAVILFVASLVPFGTFFTDKNLRD